MVTVKLVVLEDLGRKGNQPYKFKVQTNNGDDIEGYDGSVVTLDIWDENLIEPLNIKVNRIMELPVKFDQKWNSFKLVEWKVKEQLAEQEMDQFIHQEFISKFDDRDHDEIVNLTNEITSSTWRDPLWNYKALFEYSPSYSEESCFRALVYSKRYLDIFSETQKQEIIKKYTELNWVPNNIGVNWIGDAIHNKLSYQVRKNFEDHPDIEFIGSEELITREYSNFRLKGRYDFVVEIHGIIYIIDFKTRRSDYLTPSAALMPFAKKMLQKNRDQILRYIDMFDSEKEIRGLIYEVAVDSGEIRSLPIKYDENMIEEALDLYKELVVIEKSGEIPDIPSDYSIDSFPCQSCEFSVICWKEN